MKILVGYNATDGGTEGLKLALQHAQAFNAEVILLASLMIGDEGHAFKSNTMDDAKQRVAEAKKSFEAAGIACRTEILVRGRSPGEDIVQYAKENQIDLIIIGVRIRSRLGKVLLGSTAQYVIIEAPCPVLTFKS
ncbi:MAG: universal stress protein [Dissulfuribacterales bacterium]